MVSLVDFQEAIISLLKSDANLVAAVGPEIREDEYQATNWLYPCVRVGGPTLGAPMGVCNSRGVFQVLVYSTEASSLRCAALTDLVVAALEKKVFVGVKVTMSTIYISVVRPPTRAAGSAWRATVECSTIATTVV